MIGGTLADYAADLEKLAGRMRDQGTEIERLTLCIENGTILKLKLEDEVVETQTFPGRTKEDRDAQFRQYLRGIPDWQRLDAEIRDDTRARRRQQREYEYNAQLYKIRLAVLRTMRGGRDAE